MTTTGSLTHVPPRGPGAGALGPVILDPGIGEPASWLRRVVALLLDWAVLAFATFLILGNVGSFPPVPFYTVDGLTHWPRVGTWPWWGVVALIASYVLLQAYTGRTPGKAAVAISVVDDTSGRPVGLLRTVARWILHLFDAILCIGYLRPLWHAEGRTFADSGVRSLVVHRPAERATAVSLAATTVCVVAVAAVVTSSMGARSVGTSSVSCAAPGDLPRATVTRDSVQEWATRLWFIRREIPAGPQPVRIDLEGVPSGTQQLLVTAAPFGTSGDDLRDADRAHTWTVGLTEFPMLEIDPSDADGLTADASGMLSQPWSMEIAGPAADRLGPGISVQIVMVGPDGEQPLCAAGLADG